MHAHPLKTQVGGRSTGAVLPGWAVQIRFLPMGVCYSLDHDLLVDRRYVLVTRVLAYIQYFSKAVPVFELKLKLLPEGALIMTPPR